MKKKFKKAKWDSLNYYELRESRENQVSYKIVDKGNGPETKVLTKKSKGRIVSVGEIKISKHLVKLGIKYKREKTFRSCVNPATKCPLRYDFYLPDYKLLIEFDGNHHKYRMKGSSNKDFVEQRKRDLIKDKWAKSSGYQLLRIPSSDINNIPDIINKVITPLKDV